MQREPLPRQEFESVDYTVRRIVSETNDHIDNGRIEEAEALVPRLESYAETRTLALFHADDIAAVLFRLGRDAEGRAALEHGRGSRIGGVMRARFSREAVDMLLAEAARRVTARRADDALDLYQQVLALLAHHELRGNPYELGDDASRYTSGVSGFFSNMYLVMRYLVHRLGEEEFADRPFVERPVARDFDPDYRGEPPPWRLATFDFIEE